MAQHQLPAHQCDVISRGNVALRRQTAGVFKSGVVHSQLRRPPVHPLHKGFLAARQMLRQCHGAVIGGYHTHGLQHLVYGQPLPLLQPDLTAAHGTGVR